MTLSKKPNDERRTNIFRIRLTDEERQKLDKAADLNFLNTSTWARADLIWLARQQEKRESSK